MSRSIGAKIEKGALGVMVRPVTFKDDEKGGFYGTRHKRAKGDIGSFSRASCARLRRALCVSRPFFRYHLFGLTLTIPAKEILSGEKVRELWHSFRVRWSKKYPLVPFVWRIELQKRKQAHFHLVLYAPMVNKGFRTSPDSSFVVACDLRELWEDVIRRYLLIPRKDLFDSLLSADDFAAFLRYGVKIDDLNGKRAAGIVGYLVDHETKHKQEQLGWNGRQWGVVNASSFSECRESVFACSVRDWVLIRRQFKRLQEHLRRDGKYTGRALPLTRQKDVFTSCVFGTDEKRLFLISSALADGRLGDSVPEKIPF